VDELPLVDELLPVDELVLVVAVGAAVARMVVVPLVVDVSVEVVPLVLPLVMTAAVVTVSLVPEYEAAASAPKAPTAATLAIVDPIVRRRRRATARSRSTGLRRDVFMPTACAGVSFGFVTAGPVIQPSDGGHGRDIRRGHGAPRRPATPIGHQSEEHSRMNRLARLVALGGTVAALLAGLTAGTVAAAGSPVVGHVYVNNNTATRNSVAGFDRHADGSLTTLAGSPFDAGGAGTGQPFGSAGGLQRSSDGRYLLATDPGSNQISVLKIKPDGSLKLVEVDSSNGLTPDSIATRQDLVYVANTGAGGSNYTGFQLNAGGHLSAIADSTFALPDTALPGQVLISPDGRRLVATRVGPSGGPSYLDGFAIGRDGRLTAAPGSPFAAQRIGPFGSAFSPTNGDQLFVSNAHDGAGNGSVSVYDVAANGALTAIGGSPFADSQTAPCWVAVSPDGNALFAINTGSSSISRYTVAANGTLGLVGSTAFNSPTGLRPFDAAITADGAFLYVVDAGAVKVSAFAIDGTTVTELAGSPVAVDGGGAPFGIVAD